MNGKNWKKVEDYVATRTSTQARSHAQKFFGNVVKTNQQSMEEFLDRISQDSLNHLKRVAQQCQDSKVSINADTMCDQPEVVELVMMHMSKGYHEEEIELVKQQFMLVGGHDINAPSYKMKESSSGGKNKKPTNKRKSSENKDQNN